MNTALPQLISSFLWLLPACAATLAPSPAIEASVQTSGNWSEAPLAVQILESVAIENEDAFFPLLDVLSSARGTDKEIYELALQEVSKGAWLDQLATLQLGLATKEASPRIQAAYEWYNALSDKRDCASWVWYNERTACSVEELQALQKEQVTVLPALLPFDHPSTPLATPAAVLYTDIWSPSLRPLLEQLKLQGTSFVLRWQPSTSYPSTPLVLSAYGAALDIKKSDYLAIDDRRQDAPAAPQKAFASGAANEMDLSMAQLWQHPESAPASLRPLTRMELLGLGEKAAHFILSSQDPMSSLVQLSQDFPKYAAALSDVQVEPQDPILQELARNRELYESGTNAVWLNGLPLSAKQMDLFALTKMMRSEWERIQALEVLGLNTTQASTIISHPAMSDAMSASSSSSGGPGGNLGELFDASDRLEEGKAILWWNDLEKDNRYVRWPSSYNALLRPTFPGSLQQIRRNLFNIVFGLDLAQRASYAYIAEIVLPFVQRMMPFRIGLVPIVGKSEHSQQIAQLVTYMFHHVSKSDAMALCTTLSRAAGETVTLAEAKEAYESIAKARVMKSKQQYIPFEEAIKQNDLSPMQHYAKRLGLDDQEPHFFINGKHAQLDASWQRHIQKTLSSQLRYVQSLVFSEEIDDSADAENLFYDLPGTFKRRNALVFPSESHPLIIKPMVNPTCDIWHQKDNYVPFLSSLLVHSPAKLFSDEVDKFSTSHEDVRICFTPTAQDVYSSTAELPSDSCVLNLNGRVVGPFDCTAMTADDLSLLYTLEKQQRLEPAIKALKQAFGKDDLTKVLEVNPAIVPGVISIVAASQLSNSPNAFGEPISNQRVDILSRLAIEHTSFSYGQDDAWIRLVATLDPSSELAQKWSAALRSLSSLPGVHLQVVLNPLIGQRELPIKRFYRDALDSQLSFDENGKLIPSSIRFGGMPESVLLNLEMDVHQAWLAFAKEARQDLDNIRLADLSSADRKSGIKAVFELESLVIEGHCRDMSDGTPPRGLELELLEQGGHYRADSLVMANMGYVQLQAPHPGLYSLNIRQGRSSDIYSIASLGTDGFKSNLVRDSIRSLSLMALDGLVIYPQFVRNPGMGEADVLEYSPAPSTSSLSLKDKIGRLWGSKPEQQEKALSAKDNAEINVFTVASGHLYERMAMIMMVSVMRHTNSSVKFWFISNFLSPEFKSFIPHLAQHYGFQYELVTYKWPHFLRHQTEKQRTIWGYKILFLDVLFPLNLDRVIFVDSDQIVRTDLKQLIDLDLKGAPYAYAPMGDDREEMEGFRFWKTGYWRDALRGRPYHISALYLVDLQRFRQLAAGDRLRGQYHALSADRNSLANLDQDLPNNMQSILPIYTLDKSWLWCETWCSDESLAEAKTIDLCNNPLTHEPKLARARRLIPEWSVYDKEIAEVARQVTEGSAFEDDVGSLEQAKLQEEDKQEHQGGMPVEETSTDSSDSRPARDEL